VVRPPDPQREERLRTLNNLKLRWQELGGENDRMPEREALSEESARLLMCSEEALELVEFLKERRYYNKVSLKIEKLFDSPAAAEARSMLAALPDKPAASGTNYREEWSLAAGRGCPEAEFKDFHASLGKGPSAQEALFGFNRKLMATDPETAVISTLSELEKNQRSKTRGASLHALMKQLPPDADFAKWENMLPTVNTADRHHPVNFCREAIFEKWAAADPAAAANHLMDHPERFNPKLIKPVADAVLSRDASVGFEWVQEFPDGPHFDYAAYMAIDYMRKAHPDEAKQLAELIGDPGLKKNALERIALPDDQAE
jgi:hypothetical protein